MSLVMGLDGKERAMKATTGDAVSSISTLYVGLLQSAPAGMDGMTLATLVGAGAGDEFAINANFYSARKAITFGSITVDASGAIRTNNNGSPLDWANTSGSTKTVAAMFITDAASGTSGLVLWVGAPDAGTATILTGRSAKINSGDLILKVD